MKYVYNNSELAHVWANKLQYDARNANNSMFFNGDTIFSYGSHFAIAKHVTNDNGETAVLITTRGYSNTTNKHIGHVRRACSHLNFIWCNNPLESHESNIKHYVSDIETETAKMIRARKPENYLQHLEYLKDRAIRYCDFFGIEKHPIFVEPLSNEQIAIMKAKTDKADKAKKANDAKKREKWLSFETTFYYPINGKELLRMKNGIVETTKGIKFTTDVAKQFFAALKANKVQTGTKFERYTVLKVSDTLLRIGCHDFDLAYLLNWGAENLSY